MQLKRFKFITTSDIRIDNVLDIIDSGQFINFRDITEGKSLVSAELSFRQRLISDLVSSLI